MDEKTDTREVILRAAAERILHYGYGKTTMSEIAADCSMSAGNIYRFFPSKIDIAEAMTRNYSAETQQAYAAILRDDARSPSQKLRDFFLSRLERTFGLLAKNPKLIELAFILARERPKYLEEEREQERRVLEKILDHGVKSGEFGVIETTAFTADIIQCATMKFRFPQLMTQESLEDLRHELGGVLRLLSAGVSARTSAREQSEPANVG